MKTKKILTIIEFIFLIIIFCLFTFGCKAKEEKKDRTLNIYTDVNDKQSLKVLNYIIDEYKMENKEININMQMSSTAPIEDELNKNKNTDIIFTSRNSLILLSQKGILTELNPYYEKNNIGDKYFNIVTCYGRYNDKLYGIPINFYTMELLYNSNIIKIGDGKVPVTVKEIKSIIKGLSAQSTNIPVILNDGMDINNTIASLVACNNIKIKTVENINNSSIESYKDLNDMQLIFDKVNLLVKEGILNKNTLEAKGESAIMRFNKGEFPVIMCSSNFINQFDNIDFARVVSDYSDIWDSKGRVPVFCNCILGVPGGSKNNGEVEKFIKFVLSDSEQKKIADMGFITGNIKTNENRKGIYGVVDWHIKNSDENSMVIGNSLPKEITSLISYKIDSIFEGKYTGNEWTDITKEVYKK